MDEEFHIARVWLLGAKAPVNVNLLDPGCPKRRKRGTKALQQPSTPRGESETLPMMPDGRPAATHRWQGQTPGSS